MDSDLSIFDHPFNCFPVSEVLQLSNFLKAHPTATMEDFLYLSNFQDEELAGPDWIAATWSLLAMHPLYCCYQNDEVVALALQLSCHSRMPCFYMQAQLASRTTMGSNIRHLPEDKCNCFMISPQRVADVVYSTHPCRT